MGTTEDLARFIAETQYDDLPAAVVAAAKIGILDGVANLLAGSSDTRDLGIMVDRIRVEGGPATIGVSVERGGRR